MSGKLIELDIVSDSKPTIWDIENAEKLQFVSFIEEKIDQKYSKKFDHYEQLVQLLQVEHATQISSLEEELQYTKHKLEEMTQHLYYLQDEHETQITNLLNELQYTKNKLKKNKIYIPLDKSKGQYFPNYHSGMLVYDKYDTSVYCHHITPLLLDMPNLIKLKLSIWEGYDNSNTLQFKLETVQHLELKWNTHCYLKQEILSEHGVNEETYTAYLKHSILKIFPNLEKLSIHLNYEHNKNNDGKVVQNIIELVESDPCKIKKITIHLEKDPRWLFTGNLKPLQLFCSTNKIEYIVD